MTRTMTVADALANARNLIRTHPGPAAEQARQIIAAEPRVAEAHLLLAAALRLLGKQDEADAAEQEGIRRSVNEPVLMQVSSHIASGHLPPAEQLLRLFLNDSPNDPEALRLLAKLAAEAGHKPQAEHLLQRALRLAPSFAAARDDLHLLSAEAGSSEVGTAEFADALRLNEEAVTQSPEDAGAWLSYGHALRIAGKSGDALAAYQRAAQITPHLGDAWWAIADMKTAIFTSDDVETMTQALQSDAASDADRAAIEFALGRAWDDLDDPAESFDHYARGNFLIAEKKPFDPDALDDLIERAIGLFTPEFFGERQGQGSADPGPIFIVGMPRSGSTLLEQMLSLHSQIEATEELIEIGRIANRLANIDDAENEYPDYLSALSDADSTTLKRAGASYLFQTLPQRRSGKPFFIDKMPGNWLHVGLIQLILPKAKIIDVRRDPMDCGVSNFFQKYATGRSFSYDLQGIGRYWRSYDRFMRHMDQVLPGRIYRLQYESLVENPETELKRLLDYLRLSFEPAVLNFHESRRAVKTSSSEQVRQPLNTKGIGRWRRYQEQLAPLAAALGIEGDTI